MDREHIVCVPQPLRVIALDNRLDLVGDIDHRTAAMRLAEHGSAAPGAGVRATARGDERHRAAAMAIAPRAEIPRQIDRFAIRIRLAVEIGQERARRRARGLAVFTLEHDAVDLREIRSLPRRSSSGGGERHDQLLERLLALADDDHVGARVEVRGRVVRWIRAANDHLRAALFRDRDHRQRVALRHQVDGDAHNRRPLTFERGSEIGDRAKRAIEHADFEATLFQVRRQIQQAERRMRAHDALFGCIEREEVAVGEQQIDRHHETCCGGRTKSTISFSTGKPYQSCSHRHCEAVRSGHRHAPGFHACRL